jgi:hypothetical protein
MNSVLSIILKIKKKKKRREKAQRILKDKILKCIKECKYVNTD